MVRESYVYEGMSWRECREPRETGGGDGVGSAPLVVRSLFSFGGSVILKI